MGTTFSGTVTSVLAGAAGPAFEVDIGVDAACHLSVPSDTTEQLRGGVLDARDCYIPDMVVTEVDLDSNLIRLSLDLPPGAVPVLSVESIDR